MGSKIIHIAGTNGKGSTAYYLNNIMIAAGKQTGLFTSPHLLKWQERIQINGENIGLSDEYEEKLYDGGYFINTAHLAKRIFEEANLDYQIIETGIGGEKDITMMFDADISVITTVAMDHTEILGRTLSEIAAQKAGIIRKNKVVYSHPQKPAVKRIIQEKAFMMRSQLVELKRNQIQHVIRNDGEITFDFTFKGHTFKNIRLSNISKIQTLNAAMAFMVALNEGIPTQVIRLGLLDPIEGRTQIINRDLVLDVAHNEKSLLALKRMLNEVFKGRRINLMFTAKRTKDIKRMSKIMRNIAYRTFLVDLDNEDFYHPKDINHLVKRSHYLKGTKGAISNSFKYAKEKSVEDDAVLVVCGSFYLTGMIYDLISSV